MKPPYIIIAEEKNIIFQISSDEEKSNKSEKKIMKNNKVNQKCNKIITEWKKIGRFFFKRSLSNDN